MQEQEKNIKGFNILELLVVIVIISVISAVAYPNFSSWKKEREVRGAAVKIKNLISNINSQVQRGQYAFVQVEVEDDPAIGELGELTVTSKGLRMDSFVNNMRDVPGWKTSFITRCGPDTEWDDDGNLDDKLEVAQIKFKSIAVNFEGDYGTVCFSKDGTYYSGDGHFKTLDDEVVSGFWICSRSSTIKKCKVQVGSSNPNVIHDNVFEVRWSRFGNVILEKWSKPKNDEEEGKWVLQ